MRYPGNIRILAEIIKKPVSLILRDYNELLSLQSTKSNISDFSDRSYRRAGEIILREIENSFSRIPTIHIGEKIYKSDETMTLYINPISGFQNFVRALPFFGTTICLKDEVTKSVSSAIIDLPVLREFYFAEKGKGAFFENNNMTRNTNATKIRVSKTDSIEKAFSGGNIKHLKARNHLDIGSLAIEHIYLASGKLDYIVNKNLTIIDYSASELIVKESGGFVANIGDKLVASNLELKDQITKSIK